MTNTVTLIHGERDAVLVDTFLSEKQSEELADWIVASGKNLTTIYVTHAHGDHYFGIRLLLSRFPKAKALATAAVVEDIRQQIDPNFIKNFWEPRFPGQIPKNPVVPNVLESNVLELEGQELLVVPLGHTDTGGTTCLHVPSIDLVVSGDCVYNNTHLHLAECDAAARKEWLAALDKVEALDPHAVVAGHGVIDPDSDPRHIGETRNYILAFNRSLESTTSARELYDKMLALYPERVNPGSLWSAAHAVKPS
ncbi:MULTISPECIES: MBL fold metallo-hydrolase [unclassified Rhizobium]|uniref:MBL fold metallo-hydrolase n=1 Tax=unclassified Rhizobium TaxID=2613769 RepID=UPI0027D3D80E|nr:MULTISPECIES: MBL fold metallo-hydrolase [unclassified Rhizobium]MDQ4408746.1 MBL fold metallo-hydrolase [Rhizobium sp. AN63]